MLRWSNTCRKCGKTYDIYSDLMAFGDLTQCETCHEEMSIVAFSCQIEGNYLYRTTECDTEQNYDIMRGFKGLDKHGMKKVVKTVVPKFRQVKLGDNKN